jgi:hypothetical protein
MDTKPLEHEALNQIMSLLARYGYKYAELSFDEDGADIFVIKKVEIGTSVYWRALRCQSKGRDVSRTNSNVVIPQNYVRGGFLAFVYVKPKDVDEAKTYLYTAEDIKTSWNKRGTEYVLYLSKDFNSKRENEMFLLNKDRAAIIEDVLMEEEHEIGENNINVLTDVGFYFKMWQKTGGMPSIEYIKEIYTDETMNYLIDTEIFVFLLCASIIQNQDYDSSLAIDWAFRILKEFNCNKNVIPDFKEGRTFYSDVAVTYHRTWVKEIESPDGKVGGYHLHIGDKEESVDAYVMKSGKYGVSYRGIE